MFNLIQTHHGISCSDIEASKRILRAIGFSDTQPGAPEPLVYRNQKDDYIGQVTAPVLGDEYHTHYVENPVTGHQIDLIEIQPAALVPRPCNETAQGDLVIGFPSDDPLATGAGGGKAGGAGVRRAYRGKFGSSFSKKLARSSRLIKRNPSASRLSFPWDSSHSHTRCGSQPLSKRARSAGGISK